MSGRIVAASRPGQPTTDHGIRQPGGKLDTPDRKLQCANLINGLKRFRELGEPLVVAGDFNLLPDSATFQELERMGLVNLVVQNGITVAKANNDFLMVVALKSSMASKSGNASWPSLSELLTGNRMEQPRGRSPCCSGR